MPNTREINRRIKSVQNTRQITRAMEMVSATKMRRAQAAVSRSRDYADKANRLMAAASGAGEPLGQPLLADRPVKKLAIVTFTSDGGLCGAMNTNVLRETRLAAEKESGSPTFVAVGKKAQNTLSRTGATLLASFTELPDTPHYTDVLPIAKIVIDEFTAGTVDRVLISYPRFISTLTNQPEVSRLLPATSSAPAEEPLTETSALTVFEPSPESVLETLLPRVIEVRLWQALLETKASEHSARMISMRNASTNASDLLDELKLSFNQARQAAITTEIAEIAAAAG